MHCGEIVAVNKSCCWACGKPWRLADVNETTAQISVPNYSPSLQRQSALKEALAKKEAEVNAHKKAKDLIYEQRLKTRKKGSSVKEFRGFGLFDLFSYFPLWF